jgi:hypothetical protein
MGKFMKNKAGNTYKAVLDKTASHHDLNEEDCAY